jgi:hypothetical protein
VADVFQQWLRASGKLDPDGWAPTADLFDSFRRFCAATGAPDLGGVQGFTKKLKRTLIPHRRKLARGWRGYRLRQHGPRMVAYFKRVGDSG